MNIRSKKIYKVKRGRRVTKEEAINQLKIELSMWESDCKSYHKTKEALKMAIKALQESSCEDAVSRKDMYFKLTNGAYLNETTEQFIDRLVKELEDMPPVTPTQRWIPVSERLPNAQKDGDKDFSDWVQVSLRINPYQNIVCSAYYCFSEKKWYMERFGCGVVIAWMPLPKPYKSEREEE